jgi:IS5 family transposase
LRSNRCGYAEKSRERRGTSEQDLFRSRLGEIIALRHPLVRLAREMDWAFLERKTV